MKLTNISLAILVALGLAACGGSDDNTPQTSDNQEAGHKNQTPTGGDGGNENTTPTTPTSQKSGLDPERSAPDLTVPKDLQSDVSARKAIYLSNGFADNALGYPNDGVTYKKNEGTDPANVKYLSMYNFAEQGDVIPSDKIPSGMPPGAAGAIYVGQNPNIDTLNAFALGKDGLYYRVRSYSKSGYDKNAKFFLTTNATPTDEDDSGIKKWSGSTATKPVAGVDQDKVVFIANANLLPTTVKLDLGKPAGYDLTKSQVILDSVNVLGKTYNATAKGQQLDLNGLEVKREIQITPVTSSYTILNGKESAQNTDDLAITKDIDLGNIKAYNLPYSIAFVTIDPSKKYEKDIFASGAFTVDGLQTVSLPKQGRAFYTGKSFNATVEGDIKLTADFFDDRAGVVGTVTNRQNIVTKQKLPNLRLGRLTLTDGSEHHTHAATIAAKPETAVTGDPKVTGWSVQFYGLEAQEAAGMLTGPNNYREVYNSQRGKLTNLSNTADTK